MSPDGTPSLAKAGLHRGLPSVRAFAREHNLRVDHIRHRRSGFCGGLYLYI